MSMEFLIEESIKITRMLDKNSQNITIIIDSILDEKMVNMGVILGTEIDNGFRLFVKFNI